jgi:peptide-methionine (S)-S-oxide reductase
MNARVLVGLAVLLLVAAADPAVTAQDVSSKSSEPADKEKGSAKEKVAPREEWATFAGGCFWSMEAVFERVKGVKTVINGFSGGGVPNPTNQMVCTGQTGHAETTHILFDPKVVTYEDLLRVFFKAHDPTTPNRQGDDFGPQYRSVIFYHSQVQREAALKVYRELTTRKSFRDPIVTDLVRFNDFYPAEEYHQDYYLNHRGNEYSTIYIEPKLRKLHLTGKPVARKRGK